MTTNYLITCFTQFKEQKNLAIIKFEFVIEIKIAYL